MSRKFIETESPGWVADGLISEAQRQQLIARYPPEAQALRLLPLLGSVLVGLSGLSLVAANWQGLPATLRLALLLGSLVLLELRVWGLGPALPLRPLARLALCGVTLLTMKSCSRATPPLRSACATPSPTTSSAPPSAYISAVSITR